MEPMYCRGCGSPLASGRFCPDCGHDRERHPAPARGRNWVVIAVCASALAAAGVTTTLLLTGGSEPARAAPATAAAVDEGETYRATLKTTLAPVLRDNQRLSNALAQLSGRKVTGARAAVSRAKRSTTLAQGATGALTVPAESIEIGTATEQFLDRQASYLSAVAAILANPRSSSVSEIRTLQSNLTSAMIAAGASPKSVSGAGTLASWASRRKKAAARRTRAATASAPPKAAAAAPAPTGSACDQNISARGVGCSFASNTFWGYWLHTSRGDGTSFTVWDPSGSMLKTVNCSGTAPVTCTTNAGGVVTFPIGAVNAYTFSAAEAYAASHDLGPDPYS
jgi:hypothetical protein